VPEAKWLQGIDQDNVQVAGESAMLKTIVQDNHFRGMFVNRSPCGRDPIGVL
jgi:hypothetical protein